MEHICLFGGTFDPVHNGHISATRGVISSLKPQEFIFIPAFIPPHKESGPVMNGKHRLEMLRLASEEIASSSVSDAELKREGISYTIDTVRSFKRKYPDKEITFVTGADSVPHFHMWKNAGQIIQECTVVIITRPGFSLEFPKDFDRVLPGAADMLREHILRLDTPDISSSDIRKRLKTGREISSLVPSPVEAYISQHGLYS